MVLKQRGGLGKGGEGGGGARVVRVGWGLGGEGGLGRGTKVAVPRHWATPRTVQSVKKAPHPMLGCGATTTLILCCRFLVGFGAEMTAEGPKTGWAEPVVAFLAHFTPREPDGEWEDYASTSYEIACAALVALGQADATETGARPRQPPIIPALLPRWDDICVSVLWLAEQQRLIQYVPLSFDTVPDIRASSGLGPAHATPEVLALLQDLGLSEGGVWSAAAEEVFWRDQPGNWQLSVTSDVRFKDALEVATYSIPDDVRWQIDRLITVTDHDVAAAQAASVKWHTEARLKSGPKAPISDPLTAEQAWQSVIFIRRYELDRLFFQRWRLSDGWLTVDDSQRGIEIFHDPLAIDMRRAVVARLFPERTYVHESLRS